MKVRITVQISEELAEYIKKESEAQSISVSEFFRISVEEYLTKIENQNQWLKLVQTK